MVCLESLDKRSRCERPQRYDDNPAEIGLVDEHDGLIPPVDFFQGVLLSGRAGIPLDQGIFLSSQLFEPLL